VGRDLHRGRLAVGRPHLREEPLKLVGPGVVLSLGSSRLPIAWEIVP
jgi:hypothetical protein